MELQCPICLEADTDGRWYQCANGHYFCRGCYNRHVHAKVLAGASPRCPQCRIRLPSGEPIYCLAAQQVIAAKKQATIDEVQQAEAEASAAEVAAAAEAADAYAAQEADDAANRLAAELESQEAAQKAEAASKADAQSQALAKAAGDDFVEAQARLLTEYSRKRSREKAASVNAIEMKQLVRRLLADGDINKLTAKRVRLEIESALGLEARELKPRKSEITACIDMVLNECASCQADLSGHANQDELEDPSDLRMYCIPCWKAYALG